MDIPIVDELNKTEIYRTSYYLASICSFDP